MCGVHICNIFEKTFASEPRHLEVDNPTILLIPHSLCDIGSYGLYGKSP